MLVQRNKSEIITQTMNSGESVSAMSLKECLMKVGTPIYSMRQANQAEQHLDGA